MTRRRAAGTTLGVLVVLVVLSACGSNSGGGGSSPSPTTAAASSAQTTPAPASPTSNTPSPAATVTVTVVPTFTTVTATATATATQPAPTVTTQPISDLGCSYPQQTDALTAEDTLCFYLASINSSNWDAACAINTSVPCSQLQSGAVSSIWSNVNIPFSTATDAHPITFTGRTYQSSDEGRGGQNCTDWNLTYMMTPTTSASTGLTSWHITSSSGTSSSC